MILTPQHVLEAVAEAFRVTTDEIRDTDSKTEKMIRARIVVVGVCRFCGYSYPEIALQAFNSKAHSSQQYRFVQWERDFAGCERHWWVDHVRARYGIPSVDGLSGALAEKFRIEQAA